MDISSLPTLQGRNQNTFSRPPFDRSDLCIHELFAHHALHSPTHPLFAYADDEQKLHYIHYSKAYNAIRRASNIVSKGCAHARITSDTQPVIGILAAIGIMHNGYVPFPISPRNSAAAVAQLMRDTNTSQIYTNPDTANHRLALSAIEILAKDGINPGVLPAPHYEDLFNESDCEGPQAVKLDSSSYALILHSSGSTNLPKPIRFTHQNFLRWGLLPYYGDVDLCGKVIAAHSLPLFHAMGAIQFVYTSCTGMIMGCFKPTYPPVFPTSDVFLQSLVATQSNIVYCVPSHVESWARSPENLPILQALDLIVYAGAPLNEKIGTALSSVGVRLVPFYGTTEIGCFSKFIADPTIQTPDLWQYFQISPQLDVKQIFREDCPDLFEPFIQKTERFSPHVLNASVDGIPGFSTSDLLQTHPSRPGFFRVYGRADDQLILSTGENTNPAPLESIIIQDPNITAAIIFGHGRFQNGVLIQPAVAFDSTNENLLSNFRNKIWPTVEKANRYGPTFSRIMKEMILVTKPSKPMEFTAKGTPRRQFVIDTYAEEINTLYDIVKGSSQPDLIPPKAWTKDTTTSFVRNVVEDILGQKLLDSDDLFQQGCDSLKATWIRNTLYQALRSATTIPVHTVSHNFLYSNPTIEALSSFLLRKISNIVELNGNETVIQKANEMRELVKKYDSSKFVSLNPRTHEAGHIVLITGTTGSFGSHLLAHLLADPSVARIFALNKAGNGTLKERQRQAFETWGLEITLLESQKLVLAEGDAAFTSFGLDNAQFKEVQESVTTVIHNAFKSLIEGVQNLLNFSLACGSRFVFVSSVAVVSRHPTRTIVPEELVSAETAVENGYSESKWISEQLVISARDKGLSSSIVRVGQLCGDRNKGRWNPKEWFPSIVLAGPELGSLPSRDLDQNLYWLPVDVAASALLEIAQHTDHVPVYHLVAPHSAKWNTILGTLAKHLDLPLLPYSQWVSLLEAKAASNEVTGRSLNAFQLLQFYKNTANSEYSLHMSTRNAELASQALVHSDPPSPADAIKYLAYWERKAAV